MKDIESLKLNIDESDKFKDKLVSNKKDKLKK